MLHSAPSRNPGSCSLLTRWKALQHLDLRAMHRFVSSITVTGTPLLPSILTIPKGSERALPDYCSCPGVRKTTLSYTAFIFPATAPESNPSSSIRSRPRVLPLKSRASSAFRPHPPHHAKRCSIPQSTSCQHRHIPRNRRRQQGSCRPSPP